MPTYSGYSLAERGNFELCQHIIGRLKYKNSTDSHGETPLHWAAEKGHYDVCKLILENDGFRNPKDDKGITPLNLAARKNDLELCKLIINNLVNNKNPKHLGGWTPFHFAVNVTPGLSGF